MSKAVFVMDMPENGCQDCYICKSSLFKTICGITGNGVSGNHERGGFPEECPLKPMPEKKPEFKFMQCKGSVFGVQEVPNLENKGWNDCIDEICKSDIIPYWQNEICPIESITAAKINVSNLECIPVFKSDNDQTDE